MGKNIKIKAKIRLVKGPAREILPICSVVKLWPKITTAPGAIILMGKIMDNAVIIKPNGSNLNSAQAPYF